MKHWHHHSPFIDFGLKKFFVIRDCGIFATKSNIIERSIPMCMYVQYVMCVVVRNVGSLHRRECMLPLWNCTTPPIAKISQCPVFPVFTPQHTVERVVVQEMHMKCAKSA